MLRAKREGTDSFYYKTCLKKKIAVKNGSKYIFGGDFLRFKKLEFILLIILAVVLISGAYLERDFEQLSDSVLRLRVVANSDSDKDQQVKLKVKDEIFAMASELCQTAQDRPDAEEIIRAALPELKEKAEETLEKNGFLYGAEVFLEPEIFPTREYEGFTMPAGEYLSLRIELGEAEGQNWWCVIFPPLCTAAATGSIEDAAEAGGFTQGQVSLVTGEEEGYVFKFRALEFLAWLKELF